MKTFRAILLASSLAFLCSGQAPAPAGKIIRLDPEFDKLVSKDARIERMATGFTFTEGPLWRPQGVLWFSDVPGNVVRSMTRSGEVKVIIDKAGGTVNAPPGSFIGPNGMIADKDGGV